MVIPTWWPTQYNQILFSREGMDISVADPFFLNSEPDLNLEVLVRLWASYLSPFFCSAPNIFFLLGSAFVFYKGLIHFRFYFQKSDSFAISIRIRNTLADGGTGPGPAVSALLTGTHREYFHTCSTLSALSWVEIPVAAEPHGQLALYNTFHVQSFEIYKSLRAWNKVRYGGQVCTWEYVCDIFCRQGLVTAREFWFLNGGGGG